MAKQRDDARVDAAKAEGARRPGSGKAAARRTPDDPATARRREREKRTVSQMISLYCAGHHAKEGAVETGYAGEAMCSECKMLDDYCVLRTERCRSMATKTSCDKCGNQCYAAAQKEKVREVMRYAGPRMLRKHPVAAVRHLLGK